MGQQQLLLIVLGVILVGVAVVLGIQYFGVGANEGAKDELVAHNAIIGANAQEWYKKPVAMGGGGGYFTTNGGAITSFQTYFADKLINLHTTPNSDQTTGYQITACTDNSITILATPKANQGFTFSNVTTIVTPTGMQTTIN